MELLLASYDPHVLKTSVLRPTLQLLKQAGVDTKALSLPVAGNGNDAASLSVFLTTKLPAWLILQPPQQQLKFVVLVRHAAALHHDGGGPRHTAAAASTLRVPALRVLVMYLALLASVVVVGLQSIHQINVNKHAHAYENALAQLDAPVAPPALPPGAFEYTANALVTKHAERASRALLAQRKHEVALLSKHRKDVEKFVQTRYDAIKDQPINGYFRIQAHNAYETIPWLASNQNIGFLWLVVACDRIDLDIKLNANGEVVLYHAPNNKALAYVLSRMDPNHTHLEDVLEWVGAAMSHFPQHFQGINIENHGVPAELIRLAFERAGILHKVASLPSGNLPTVGATVEAGKNLVVFVDRVPQSRGRGTGRGTGGHDQITGPIQGHPWLLFTKDHFNENEYACKDVKRCNAEENVVVKRQDLGSRRHITAQREWKEANAFANNAVGMPMGENEQRAFDLSVHYDLARRGAFNPWGVKNSSVVGLGINRDFLKINEDVVRNLYENIALVSSPVQRQHLAQRAKALEPFLTEMQNALTLANRGTRQSGSVGAIGAVSAVPAFMYEIAETLLMKSPMARFVIVHSAEKYASHASRASTQPRLASVSAAYKFFESEYKTTLSGYLPLMPMGLFCELCVMVVRARKGKNGTKDVKVRINASQ